MGWLGQLASKSSRNEKHENTPEGIRIRHFESAFCPEDNDRRKRVLERVETHDDRRDRARRKVERARIMRRHFDVDFRARQWLAGNGALRKVSVHFH